MSSSEGNTLCSYHRAARKARNVFLVDWPISESGPKQTFLLRTSGVYRYICIINTINSPAAGDSANFRFRSREIKMRSSSDLTHEGWRFNTISLAFNGIRLSRRHPALIDAKPLETPPPPVPPTKKGVSWNLRRKSQWFPFYILAYGRASGFSSICPRNSCGERRVPPLRKTWFEFSAAISSHRRTSRRTRFIATPHIYIATDYSKVRMSTWQKGKNMNSNEIFSSLMLRMDLHILLPVEYC